MATATHTPDYAPGIVVFPLTGLTTVAPSPKWEALRFASTVPHNLPCRERFAERFSEDVFGFSKT